MLYTIGREDLYDQLLIDYPNLKKVTGGYAFINAADAIEEARRLTNGKYKTMGFQRGTYSVYIMEGNFVNTYQQKLTKDCRILHKYQP